MGQPQACAYSPGLLDRLWPLQLAITLDCECCTWERLRSTQARPPFVGSPTTCPSPARKPLLHPPILSPYRLQSVLPLSGHLSNRGLPLSSYSLCPVLSSSPPGVSSILPSLGPILPPSLTPNGLSLASFSFCAPSDPLLGCRPDLPPSNLFFLPFLESAEARSPEHSPDPRLP